MVIAFFVLGSCHGPGAARPTRKRRCSSNGHVLMTVGADGARRPSIGDRACRRTRHPGAAVVSVIISSFKQHRQDRHRFAPTGFAGLSSFVNGMTFGSYPFLMSSSTARSSPRVTFLILLFCSMAAWYVARVSSKFCWVIYYLHLLDGRAVRMVMFASQRPRTPWAQHPYTIPIVYLGFAGLAIFMFVGAAETIPIESRRRPPSIVDLCARSSLWFCRSASAISWAS